MVEICLIGVLSWFLAYDVCVCRNLLFNTKKVCFQKAKGTEICLILSARNNYVGLNPFVTSIGYWSSISISVTIICLKVIVLLLHWYI